MEARVRSLVCLALLAAACGGTPIDSIVRIEARPAGGAIVTGVHGVYDGLGEHEHTYVVRVELDTAGRVVARDDRGEALEPVTASMPGSRQFGDGTHLEVLPRDYDMPGPAVARRLDAHGDELWRMQLPLEYVADSCADGGALILGGDPVEPKDGGYIFGARVVKLNADSSLSWQVVLH
jgi:hypothetical protein